MLQLEHIGISDLPSAAPEIITAAGERNIWTFYGEMGAGKTTLIKALCRQLGVTGPVSSPTYSLVNEYRTADDRIIYHFDFYRISSIEEAYDIGYEEYFYSGNTCLIEWPERIAELLEGEDAARIMIDKTSEQERTIQVE